MVMVMVALRPLQDSLPLQLPSPIMPDWRRQKLFSIAVAYKNWALYSFHYQWCQPGSHKNCLQYNFHHQWCHSVQYKKWLQYSSHFQLCLSVKHKILLAVQLPIPMMPFWPKLRPGLDGSEQELSAVQLLFPMKPLWLSHEPPSIQLSSPIWCQSAADKIWEIYNFYFQWCHSGWNKQGLMYSFHSQWSHSGFHKMRTNN